MALRANSPLVSSETDFKTMSEINVTPCVARPMPRISATRVRISTPPVVMNMISSSSPTSLAPTTIPLRSLSAIARTPWVPRPEWRKSASTVRLPKPFSVATSTAY